VDRDRINLSLRAEPPYGHVAQVATGSLCERLRWKRKAVNDMRLAIDEATIMLLGPTPAKGRLNIEITTEDRTVTITMRATGQRTVVPTARVDRFNKIVSPLVDSAKLDAKGHTVSLVRAG